jgi:hypothetical protein
MSAYVVYTVYAEHGGKRYSRQLLLKEEQDTYENVQGWVRVMMVSATADLPRGVTLTWARNGEPWDPFGAHG